MAVLLSPIGGVAAQFFDNSGAPLTGGKLYTYQAGTTTPVSTYTSSTGGTPHSNPIVLDAAGRVPGGEIWLTDGAQYKFVIKTSTDTLIGTYDNLVGINSNFVNYTSSQEIQTATASQTVFTLTTMAYQPGTNSLSVFVDGVNQYGPGAQYAYVETDSTTVTFEAGLHVGAQVKFTTTAINSSSYGDAFQVSYTPPFTGSTTTNVGNKLAQYVSVKDFGAVGDGTTDDTAALQNALNTNLCVYIPEGNYVVTNLTIKKGQTVYGCGHSSVLSVKTGATGAVIGIVGTNIGAGRIENVKLQDFCIVGIASVADAIRVENAYRVALINLYITGCANGISMERVELIDVIESQIVSNESYGVNATRDSDSLLNSWVSFTNCIINGNILGGAFFQDTASVVFTNTKIINNHDFGVEAKVKATKIGLVRCTYFQMSSCDIDSNWNASIRLYNQANFSICNNWISGGRTSTQTNLNPAGQGIYIENSSYGTLEGNIIFACGSNGIEIKGAGSAYNSILGGWIGGNGDFAGIYINAGSNHTINGVTVQSSGGSGFTQQYGVYFDNTDDPLSNAHLIVGNMVIDHVGASFTLVGANTKCSLNNYTQAEIFNTPDSYEFNVDNVQCAWLGGNAFRPGADNTSYLGLSTYRWKEIRAVDYYAGANVKGTSGSFTTTDSKTVTVTNGLITSIV